MGQKRGGANVRVNGDEHATSSRERLLQAIGGVNAGNTRGVSLSP